MLLRGRLRKIKRRHAKELSTNIFYDLNKNSFPLDLTWQGGDTAIAKFKITDNGTVIPNELKQGKIVVQKNSEMLIGATVKSVLKVYSHQHYRDTKS